MRSTVRQLPVGDFLCVAAPRAALGGAAPAATGGGGGGGGSAERSWLVLDTVIERKQLPDFLSTIKSRRHYHSQLARLSRCGLRRTYYLLEGWLHHWQHAAERERMRCELGKIETTAGLAVAQTGCVDETVAFIGLARQRLSRQLDGLTAAQLRASGALATWAEFKRAACPPETISSAFGRMLLNVHGLSAPMVANVIARYPTPRCLAEAIDSHRRACELRGGAAEKASGWLLADVLVPGKTRRKMSETLTSFFVLDELPDDAPAPDSQLQLDSQSQSQCAD